MKQHNKMMLGFLIGVTLGLIGYYFFPEKDYAFMKRVCEIFTFVGAIFLRMVFMVVVPLILSALMLGTMELTRGAGLGRISSLSIGYTIALSATAVLIAVGLTNLLKPGAGIAVDKAALAANAGVLTIQKSVAVIQNKAWYQYIVDLLPQNPVDSCARAFSGEIIAMMFFALFFGWALSAFVKDEEHPTNQVLDSIFQASMKIIGVAMKIAPYAIFGIVINTAYRMGGSFLGNLAYYVMIVIGGLLLQFFVVYSTALYAVTKKSPLPFYKLCRHVYLYAFTTSSSNATLPVALDCAENILKLPKKIGRSVLTIGASANQNGSALYEGVTVIFLAQVYGIDLSLGQQVLVVFMSMLASIGTAGVPGGSLPPVVALMIMVGIPGEGIGLVLGVERILDMSRTTLNVAGDLVIAKLVTASLGQADIDKMNALPDES